LDKESSTPLERALQASKSKGNDPLTNALLEALEDHQRELKKPKAA